MAEPIAKPDVWSHPTGWDCKLIEGRWRVGMAGNLDTIHDAVITVNHGPLENGMKDAEHVARWIVQQYNQTNS